MDEESHIKGSVKAWRAAFPAASAVNVRWREDVVDADLRFMCAAANCDDGTLTFVHLRVIYTLGMSDCNQKTRPLYICVEFIRFTCVAATSNAAQSLKSFQLLGLHGCYVLQVEVK